MLAYRQGPLRKRVHSSQTFRNASTREHSPAGPSPHPGDRGEISRRPDDELRRRKHDAGFDAEGGALARHSHGALLPELGSKLLRHRFERITLSIRRLIRHRERSIPRRSRLLARIVELQSSRALRLRFRHHRIRRSFHLQFQAGRRLRDRNQRHGRAHQRLSRHTSHSFARLSGQAARRNQNVSRADANDARIVASSRYQQASR